MDGEFIMSTNEVRFIVLSGDGINCERETKKAFELVGAEANIVHINDLLESPEVLSKYDGMAIPGGFSFGDELGSGQILALKIRHGLMNHFNQFIQDKKPIIGICNGFQVLVKLGAISTRKSERTLSLTQNRQGTFIDCWVTLTNENSHCIWTRDLPHEFELPIRHGEGRVVLKDDEAVVKEIKDQGIVALKYKDDINGSYERIAGLCDPSGLIFGLMPHPEAYMFEGLKPGHKTDVFANGVGQLIFKNAVNYLKERRHV